MFTCKKKKFKKKLPVIESRIFASRISRFTHTRVYTVTRDQKHNQSIVDLLDYTTLQWTIDCCGFYRAGLLSAAMPMNCDLINGGVVQRNGCDGCLKT